MIRGGTAVGIPVNGVTIGATSAESVEAVRQELTALCERTAVAAGDALNLLSARIAKIPFPLSIYIARVARESWAQERAA